MYNIIPVQHGCSVYVDALLRSLTFRKPLLRPYPEALATTASGQGWSVLSSILPLPRSLGKPRSFPPAVPTDPEQQSLLRYTYHFDAVLQVNSSCARELALRDTAGLSASMRSAMLRHQFGGPSLMAGHHNIGLTTTCTPSGAPSFICQLYVSVTWQHVFSIDHWAAAPIASVAFGEHGAPMTHSQPSEREAGYGHLASSLYRRDNGSLLAFSPQTEATIVATPYTHAQQSNNATFPHETIFMNFPPAAAQMHSGQLGYSNQPWSSPNSTPAHSEGHPGFQGLAASGFPHPHPNMPSIGGSAAALMHGEQLQPARSFCAASTENNTYSHGEGVRTTSTLSGSIATNDRDLVTGPSWQTAHMAATSVDRMSSESANASLSTSYDPKMGTGVKSKPCLWHGCNHVIEDSWTIANIRKHIEMFHGLTFQGSGSGLQTIRCGWAGCSCKKALQLRALCRHIHTKHGLSVTTCSRCGKQLSRIDCLKRHQRSKIACKPHLYVPRNDQST